MYLVYQDSQSTPAAAKKKTVAPAKPAATDKPAQNQPAASPTTPTTTTPAATGTTGTLVPPPNNTDNQPKTMTPLLWIAFGFVAALVVVLVMALWFPLKDRKNGPGILRFLMALCAGFASAFFTGNALVNGQITQPGFTFGFSGAAGFAAFIIVWYGYRIVESLFPNLKDGDEPAAMDITNNFTFQSAAQKIAESRGCGITFDGFSREELDAPLRPQPIESKTWNDLLLTLRGVTQRQGVRPYAVEKVGSTFILKVEEKV
jgi:hypothetical protein